MTSFAPASPRSTSPRAASILACFLAVTSALTAFVRYGDSGVLYAMNALQVNGHSGVLGPAMVVAAVLTAWRAAARPAGIDRILLWAIPPALALLTVPLFRGIGSDGDGFDVGFVGLYCSLCIGWLCLLRTSAPAARVPYAVALVAVAALSFGYVAVTVEAPVYAFNPYTYDYMECGGLGAVAAPAAAPGQSQAELTGLCDRAGARATLRAVFGGGLGFGAVVALGVSAAGRRERRG